MMKSWGREGGISHFYVLVEKMLDSKNDSVYLPISSWEQGFITE